MKRHTTHRTHSDKGIGMSCNTHHTKWNKVTSHRRSQHIHTHTHIHSERHLSTSMGCMVGRIELAIYSGPTDSAMLS
jgi:hypothetical protein